MSAFLITFMIIGLIELIGVIVYATTRKVPERMLEGAVLNGLLMAVLGLWAAFLYFE